MLQMCSVFTQDYEEFKVLTLLLGKTVISEIYKADLYSLQQNQITCSLSDG